MFHPQQFCLQLYGCLKFQGLVGTRLASCSMAELVTEHAAALMLPEAHEVALRGGYLTAKLGQVGALPVAVPSGKNDTLEHLRQLAHVEEVVELCGRRQHLGLNLVPERDRHGHQLLRQLGRLGGHDLGVEPPLDEGSEDVVDGHGGGLRHVVDAELALEAVGAL